MRGERRELRKVREPNSDFIKKPGQNVSMNAQVRSYVLAFQFFAEFRVFSKKFADALFGIERLKRMNTRHCLNITLFGKNPHGTFKAPVVVKQVLKLVFFDINQLRIFVNPDALR